MCKSDLAVYGGKALRTSPFPPRGAMGNEERAAVQEVLAYYKNVAEDMPFQGHFEERYTNAFVAYQGGEGYCDAVNSGTAGLYIAIAALKLPKGSSILVSPVTDPGTISAIILNGLVPVLVDSAQGSFNVNIETIKERMTDAVSAFVIVHVGGVAVRMDEIKEYAYTHGIKVIEDCSQAHGAEVCTQKVGTFGNVAVFSTMFSKNHISGSCGGLIYTKDAALFERIRSYADRGKNFANGKRDLKRPSLNLYPSLNFNQDEISCGIGEASLKKLDNMRKRRIDFLIQLRDVLSRCSYVQGAYLVTDEMSPFFYPLKLSLDKISCSKIAFAEAVGAEGIAMNPDYDFLVSDWPWCQQYLGDSFTPHNAKQFRERTFNILFNENYGKQEAVDIGEAIFKVEKSYGR